MLHMQGDEEAAKKIYLHIIQFNKDNATVLAVASNNMVAINKVGGGSCCCPRAYDLLFSTTCACSAVSSLPLLTPI